MQNIYRNICSIPEKFTGKKNINIKQLIKESGYYKNKESIKLEELINFIKLNPEYVKKWLQYSSDKRTSSGWYFSEMNYKYLIGFYLDGKDEVVEEYASEYDACAQFILKELPSIVLD